MSNELPPINLILSLPDAKKVQVLDNLFEPCSTLSNFIITHIFKERKEPFQSYKDLVESIRNELLGFLKSEESKSLLDPNYSVNTDISKIIAAHPRLGPAKKSNETTKLSDHSSNEQKSLSGTKEESEKLIQLNDSYESTFPGLRYVVFVNGRSRQTIMENMTKRIERCDIKLEREEAFNAMCDIALDRAKKLGAKL